MILSTRHQWLTLTVNPPGQGFAVNVSGHLWLFDRDGILVDNVPPVGGNHRDAIGPQYCPGCVTVVLPEGPRGGES